METRFPFLANVAEFSGCELLNHFISLGSPLFKLSNQNATEATDPALEKAEPHSTVAVFPAIPSVEHLSFPRASSSAGWKSGLGH